MLRSSGEVAEWSIVPDSKSGVLQGTEGSNPSLSASNKDNALIRQGFILSGVCYPSTKPSSMECLGTVGWYLQRA